MSSTVWHTMMSLDGFITGPDDAMEWAFELGEPSDLADEVRDGIGAILAGRRWYDVATDRYDGRAGIYGGKWDGPVFVLTHDPPERNEDPGITFLTDDFEGAHATAAEAPATSSSSCSAPRSRARRSRPGYWTRSSCMSHRCCSATASGSTAAPGPRGSTSSGRPSRTRGIRSACATA